MHERDVRWMRCEVWKGVVFEVHGINATRRLELDIIMVGSCLRMISCRNYDDCPLPSDRAKEKNEWAIVRAEVLGGRELDVIA